MNNTLLLSIGMWCLSTALVAQEVQPSASPFVVVSSRDNLRRLTPSELSQLGWSQRTEGGRTYWFRSVTDTPSSYVQASSPRSATGRELCESCQSKVSRGETLTRDCKL